MRESIGNALLLNIVIVIVGVISAFLISSIAYSKAFKVKNRIISVIDEYGGNCDFKNPYDACFNKIEDELTDMGYSSNISKDCPDYLYKNTVGIKEYERVYPQSDGIVTGHKYCVYRFVLCDTLDTSVGSGKDCRSDSNKASYYKVITFMHFDIPLIGNFLEFEVSGETSTFYDTFINVIK